MSKDQIKIGLIVPGVVVFLSLFAFFGTRLTGSEINSPVATPVLRVSSKPARPSVSIGKIALEKPVEAESLTALEEIIFREAKPLTTQNKNPRYPRIARQMGYAGKVDLELEISAEGKVTDAHILSSSGHGVLDKEAMKTVKQWRFAPAQEMGVPVSSRLQVPIAYRLKND